ncbi:MAG: 1-acyl-sn-glycerol-3-phosphate acyltransferase [Gemmatimonadota bacterium]|nr:1-acyl-sn-glycerol-3-phosphate acyltransferase [Gemmatimonadota bacterium]
MGSVIIPVARRLARHYFRVRVFGADRIPADRPVIYVAKHPQSFLYLETVILGLVAFWDDDKPAIRVLEKTNTSIHRTPLLGWYRRQVNALPAGEEYALDALTHGESLLIYPGGSRELYGPQDELRWQGRTGFARLAIRTGVAVLPFAIVGADQQHLRRASVFGAGVWLPPFPLPAPLDYRFGAPIAPPPPGSDPAELALLAESAVRELLRAGRAARRRIPWARGDAALPEPDAG